MIPDTKLAGDILVDGKHQDGGVLDYVIAHQGGGYLAKVVVGEFWHLGRGATPCDAVLAATCKPHDSGGRR